MTPELRVALSIWLNAYENACSVDRMSNDVARVNAVRKAVEGLAEASEELHKVADPEVEVPDPTVTRERIITGFPKRDSRPATQFRSTYKLPSNDHMHILIATMAEWYEAGQAVYDAEMPSRAAFRRLEDAEGELRRIIMACSRRANAEFAAYEQAQAETATLRLVSDREAEDLAALEALAGEA
jgi:hypothetical protein